MVQEKKYQIKKKTVMINSKFDMLRKQRKIYVEFIQHKNGSAAIDTTQPDHSTI